MNTDNKIIKAILDADPFTARYMAWWYVGESYAELAERICNLPQAQKEVFIKIFVK